MKARYVEGIRWLKRRRGWVAFDHTSARSFALVKTVPMRGWRRRSAEFHGSERGWSHAPSIDAAMRWVARELRGRAASIPSRVVCVMANGQVFHREIPSYLEARDSFALHRLPARPRITDSPSLVPVSISTVLLKAVQWGVDIRNQRDGIFEDHRLNVFCEDGAPPELVELVALDELKGRDGCLLATTDLFEDQAAAFWWLRNGNPFKSRPPGYPKVRGVPCELCRETLASGPRRFNPSLKVFPLDRYDYARWRAGVGR